MTEPKIEPTPEEKAQEYKECADKLGCSLGESHAAWFVMIMDLRATPLTERQRVIVNQAHRELLRHQNAFLAEFANWADPEQN